jgi:DNA polymerase III subunit epsilon
MTIYCALDLETTGLNEPEHRIIEIAALLYDEKGVRLGRWTKRVDPERPSDPKALAVHGIPDAELIGKPKFEAVIDDLLMILSKSDNIVTHNGIGFDVPFLKRETERVGRVMPDLKVIDTYVEGRWATPWGKPPKLEELCFACGVEYDRSMAHSAHYDCEVMMACYFHARSTGFFPTEGQ